MSRRNRGNAPSPSEASLAESECENERDDITEGADRVVIEYASLAECNERIGADVEALRAHREIESSEVSAFVPSAPDLGPFGPRPAIYQPNPNGPQRLIVVFARRT